VGSGEVRAIVIEKNTVPKIENAPTKKKKAKPNMHVRVFTFMRLKWPYFWMLENEHLSVKTLYSTQPFSLLHTLQIRVESKDCHKYNINALRHDISTMLQSLLGVLIKQFSHHC
jgi:hypothetical protein